MVGISNSSSGVALLKVGAAGGVSSLSIEGGLGGLGIDVLARFISFLTGFFFSFSSVLLAFSMSSTAKTSVIEVIDGGAGVSGLSVRFAFFFLSFYLS